MGNFERKALLNDKKYSLDIFEIGFVEKFIYTMWYNSIDENQKTKSWKIKQINI